MSTQEIILVTENDEAIGTMDKMEVHQKGLLHRAFSVFIFNNQGLMLLQQRAAEKYHGGGLWTNACCSHPFPGEEIEAAAARRLKEELGFSTTLKKVFAFTYKANVENNLIEHEYDHVFAGQYEGPVHLNHAEVAQCKFEEIEVIKNQLRQQPQQFTTWFHLAFPSIEQWWETHFKWA